MALADRALEDEPAEPAPPRRRTHDQATRRAPTPVRLFDHLRPRTQSVSRRVLARIALGLLPAAIGLALVGCAARETPTADSPPPPPNLSGQTVMILPVQPSRGGVPDGLDDEIAYWLGERSRAIRWVDVPTLDRTLERAPELGIHLRSLAVASFLHAEVKRIGDPLFGDLRRLSALVDARFAVLPIAAAYVPDDEGGGRIEIAAAIIETVGGRVHWFGVVAGESGAPDSPATRASAAQALGRALFP